MSDTPRVDALHFRSGGDQPYAAMMELARQLERELAQAMATIETCNLGHRFAKLADHPTKDGMSRCPHCLAHGLDQARSELAQAYERAAQMCDEMAERLQESCERDYKSDDHTARCLATAIRALKSKALLDEMVRENQKAGLYDL